ncbi:hypothetical protein HRR83_001381 [Exophiala dermatitidis]|uniref:Uncharacterized protein n=1 Tax=Exophiala dermatitidis TaxID=5970 RepID=A0AAN6EZX7_EXODE|nr:hypothetical protein HRR74_001385 [Exophiala dermatitidis]KAJ4526864.1 hypothetical protein HRR73_001661 [Exophiala dermatitidis]KAJ4532572.1 hypothetical protein HRR76_007563 [Exophiala dermatitidis]KAJ4546915.1 hypothetical protein HRR77_004454 [Exophiala dermatitidis]KAJ4573723.1 hypothetical protein HRR79_002736 [Exophiala dermatitidis]
MLALKRPQDGLDSCTVNVLPCRIHHDGPTKVTKRYWCPQIEKDGTRTAYFRGRKLRGRVLQLPAGYQGVVAKPTNQLVQTLKDNSRPTYTTVDDDIQIQDNDDEPAEPVTVLEGLSSFDEVVVWGHDQVPAPDDAFAKGFNEWIEFAQAIHGRPDKPTQQGLEDDTSQPNA